MYKNICFVILFVISLIASAQPVQKDTALFRQFKPGYIVNEVLKDTALAEKIKESGKMEFKMDFSKVDAPADTGEFIRFRHNSPVSQGLTGTCWCFAAVSFFESEIFRICGKDVRLSEMWVVYWEYMERAETFIRDSGDVYFAQGSESNAVPKIWKKYGIVPIEAYPGKENAFHDHCQMFAEMKKVLDKAKSSNLWDEKVVMPEIKAILNRHLGTPPDSFLYRERYITPIEFRDDVVKIKIHHYHSFMSTSEKGYYEKHELEEPDNWWHDKNYYNIPLGEYMDLIKNALKDSFTIAICGDISEPGFNSFNDIAVVPAFDIPPDYIDESARQHRLQNKSTTDDHCVHLVGYQEKDGVTWFLVKDSGGSGFNGSFKGYCFYHEDYVKLKMMNLLMHRDAAGKVLGRIIK